MKDYLKTRETGQLKSLTKQQQLAQALQRVSITYSSDPLLRFGDQIMFQNQFNKSFLSCDIYDRIAGLDEAYSVTTAPQIGPTARSVFILERYEKDLFTNDVLHYGQQFKLVVNPQYFHKKLYLSSSAISPQKCAKFSRLQEVSMSAKETSSNMWAIQHADPKLRFSLNGKQVQKNTPILIKHVLTAQWLAIDETIYYNDFGAQFQVFAHSFLQHNKTHNIIAERSGRKTSDIPMRSQHENNTWFALKANDPSEDFDDQTNQKPQSSQKIIKNIVLHLKQRGTTALRLLNRAFCDLLKQNKQNSLQKSEFNSVLQGFGITFTNDQDFQALFNIYCINKNDRIERAELNQFLNSLRGTINQDRIKLIFKAYDHLFQIIQGNLSLGNIVQYYDAQRHPDVIKGYRVEKEAAQDFLECWDISNAESIISDEDFIEYYRDLSAMIEQDSVFEAIILNCWHIEK